MALSGLRLEGSLDCAPMLVPPERHLALILSPLTSQRVPRGADNWCLKCHCFGEACPDDPTSPS